MKTAKKNSESKSTELIKKGRPRLNDVLIVPRGAFKKLTEVAAQTRMPLQLVYEDALWNGISTLPEMYKSVISFRKTRDGMIHEQPDDNLVQKPETNGGQKPGDLPSSAEIYSDFELAAREAASARERSDDADERSGQLAEDAEGDRSLDDAVQYAE